MTNLSGGHVGAFRQNPPNPNAPTQAEVEAISRDIEQELNAAMSQSRRSLLERAAIMIARLERAWLEGLPHDRP